jgi:hypothetical protein
LDLLYYFHFNPTSGNYHSPARVVVAKITKLFYMYGYTTKLVGSILQRCSTCQTHIGKSVKPPIYPISSSKLNERWVMDYTQFESNFWLLVIIDNFSRKVWTHGYSTKQERNVIEKLKEIFNSSGTPSILQSDNGGVSLLFFSNFCLIGIYWKCHESISL